MRLTIGPPATGCERSEEVDIYNGCLVVNGEVHDDLIPLPFSAKGPVTLWFEGRYTDRLEFAGRDVWIESMGEPRFVEDLPAHMRPLDAV